MGRNTSSKRTGRVFERWIRLKPSGWSQAVKSKRRLASACPFVRSTQRRLFICGASSRWPGGAKATARRPVGAAAGERTALTVRRGGCPPPRRRGSHWQQM